jgi:hypothetical protein
VLEVHEPSATDLDVQLRSCHDRRHACSRCDCDSVLAREWPVQVRVKYRRRNPAKLGSERGERADVEFTGDASHFPDVRRDRSSAID